MSVCFLGRNTLRHLINSSSLISGITHLNEGILCHVLRSLMPLVLPHLGFNQWDIYEKPRTPLMSTAVCSQAASVHSRITVHCLQSCLAVWKQ